jgi:dipeptidyl aminopeptidase/acylaminoacyl peptidase
MQTRLIAAFIGCLVLVGCADRESTRAAASSESAATPAASARLDPQVYSVAALYENTRFRGASWSHDGRRLLVSSDVSGIWNAYTIDRNGGPPQPLTRSTTDSIFTLSFFPADDRFLYSSDRGGDELTHIYVQAADGSTRDLTPGDKLKAVFIGWSGDDHSLFVATNERDPKYFDLYEISVDGYARTLFYKNTDGYDIGTVSRDKRYLALSKSRSTSDSDIFLYDRQSGTAKNVTAHTGSVLNTPADFTPDSTRLVYLSDEGREFQSLRSLTLVDGRKTSVYEDRWNVTAATYSKSGKRLIVSIDDDARSRFQVLDAMTLQPLAISWPSASAIRGLELDREDRTLAFYATDGSTPDELYAAQVGETPRRITSSLNQKIRRDDLVVPSVARFKSYDGLDIPGVLYVPHTATAAHKAPALVMVHGGPGDQAQIAYRAVTQALVNHGYAVFDINNRGSSGYGKTFFAMDDRKHGEADLGDVVASKSMLIGTGKVDPQRIGIIGGSYGGYMVLAALTLQPDAFAVGVDLFGISNWVRTLESIPPWWGAMRDALYAEMGDPKTDGDRLRRISPLFNAARIRVPLMVLQGQNDPRVLKRESDEIVEAARKNAVPVEYVVFPDEGHGFVKKDNEIRGYSAVIEFLDKYLKAAAVRLKPDATSN